MLPLLMCACSNLLLSLPTAAADGRTRPGGSGVAVGHDDLQARANGILARLQERQNAAAAAAGAPAAAAATPTGGITDMLRETRFGSGAEVGRHARRGDITRLSSAARALTLPPKLQEQHVQQSRLQLLQQAQDAAGMVQGSSALSQPPRPGQWVSSAPRDPRLQPRAERG
jgi:hypothetical protein